MSRKLREKIENILKNENEIFEIELKEEKIYLQLTDDRQEILEWILQELKGELK
jgi:hypothetical protein